MKKAPIESNPFDDLGPETDPKEIKRQQKEWEALRQKRNYLTHRVYAQTEQGRELLEMYKADLIMQPSAEPHMDLLEVGIREGMKKFARDIIAIVERVEKGE